MRLIIPVEAYIAADTAVIHLSECRGKRYTTAQYKCITCTFAQKFHSFRHYLSASLVRPRNNTGSIEKVQFQQLITPIICYYIYYISDILPDFFVIDIKSVEAAPVRAAPDIFKIVVGEKPFLFVDENIGIFLADKRGKPYSRYHACLFYIICCCFHSVREFICIYRQPVSDSSLPAVIDLKDFRLCRQGIKTHKVIR